MYNNNVGGQPGVAVNPFGNTFYGASSGLIRGGLGAYGEKILGSSSEYVQSNISRLFSDPQYYFQVNDQYVRNKLKVVLFPFLHRGHWTRITEPVRGRLSYKPPIYDINAPDLYIPFMAFGTYVVLAGFSLGRHGKHGAGLLFAPLISSSFPSQKQDGIPPHMFKAVIAASHPEFSSMRQQDALEFFLHFLDQVERAHGGRPEIDPARSFKFGIEDRIQCSSGKVAYNRRLDYILSLNIPLHEATNKEKLAACNDPHFQEIKFSKTRVIIGPSITILSDVSNNK